MIYYNWESAYGREGDYVYYVFHASGGTMPHADEVHYEPDREGFPNREGWRKSHKGRMYIRLDNGFVITVCRKGDGWRGTIYDPFAKKPRYSKRWYATEHLVKLAAFDAMDLIISRWIRS